MAASVSMLTRYIPQISSQKRLCTQRVLPLIVTTRQFSSGDAQESTEDDVTDTEYLEEEIDRIRNVSELSDANRRRMDSTRGMPEIKHAFQKTVKYQRRLYGRFGEKSGINPGISWPTIEELKEIRDEEREWEPSLQEMWTKLEKTRREKQEALQKREELIQKNMSQMPKLIDQYYQRLEDKAAEVRKQQERKAKLLEEAREFFGYDVDPKDSKFKDMLEEREKQRKKETKAKRKLEQAAKLAARIKMMAEESRGAAVAESENETKTVTPVNVKTATGDQKEVKLNETPDHSKTEKTPEER